MHFHSQPYNKRHNIKQNCKQNEGKQFLLASPKNMNEHYTDVLYQLNVIVNIIAINHVLDSYFANSRWF